MTSSCVSVAAVWEGGRGEGGRGREGGKERGREGGREGGRERGREREREKEREVNSTELTKSYDKRIHTETVFPAFFNSFFFSSPCRIGAMAKCSS